LIINGAIEVGTGQCREGLYALPKTMFDIFFSKLLGQFLRAGINPAPTVAEYCNHFDNLLIAKVLHISAVGMGFIPVLPTTSKN
jgi:hypothetical protein